MTPRAVVLPPTPEDLQEYLALSGAQFPLDQVTEANATALEMQADRCDVSQYESPLREAALRRGARILMGRGAALGTMDLGEYGQTPLMRWDAFIEEQEAEYRLGGFA